MPARPADALAAPRAAPPARHPAGALCAVTLLATLLAGAGGVAAQPAANSMGSLTASLAGSGLTGSGSLSADAFAGAAWVMVMLDHDGANGRLGSVRFAGKDLAPAKADASDPLHPKMWFDASAVAALGQGGRIPIEVQGTTEHPSRAGIQVTAFDQDYQKWRTPGGEVAELYAGVPLGASDGGAGVPWLLWVPVALGLLLAVAMLVRTLTRRKAAGKGQAPGSPAGKLGAPAGSTVDPAKPR